MDSWTYMILNIITILFPVGLSFDRKVHFIEKWEHAIKAIIPVATLFLVWDYWFTLEGVWHFNKDYLLNIEGLNLPLEEWLFFITVPFACIFIFDVFRCYLPKDYGAKAGYYISVILGAILLVLGLMYYQQIYTGVTFVSTGIMLLINGFWLQPRYLGLFFIAYAVHLIPFAIINGILTAFPVVIYNNMENLHLRMGTIPVEDAFYSMLLMLLNINLFEYFRSKKLSKGS